MNDILERQYKRLEHDKESSDTDYFNSLLLCGEMILKLGCSFLVTAMDETKEKYSYRIKYKLVHADGLGEWTQAIEEILSGPSFHSLIDEIKEKSKEFTCKIENTWQTNSVIHLLRVLEIANIKNEKFINKYSFIDWVKNFVCLRNKTKGHGALPPSVLSKCCIDLENSIYTVCNNIFIFNYEWSFLHQNLSKKYRVTSISNSTNKFEYLKKTTDGPRLSEGVYIYSDKPRKNELIFSDPDIKDYFFVNGHFNNTNFETLSYITGNCQPQDSSPYSIPADDLPKSITCGKSELEAYGETFSNMPPEPINYINRIDIEKEIECLLFDERNPVITLLGRGGIGKTSTLLKILHKITKESNHYDMIIWFSSRDIDLFETGPKRVKPEALDKHEIANIYCNLVGPHIKFNKNYTKENYLSEVLSFKNIEKPIIFIFDNFETLKDPLAVFYWINNNIRLPNKVVITTRFRDFKGDYPVEIVGMTEEESFSLINRHAKILGIYEKLKTVQKNNIYNEADGHPYVMKILLGELVRENKTIKKVISNREDILDALFDRTFNMLSEPAKKIYLTLSLWRSCVLEIAICAIFECQQGNECINVENAIQELINFSLIERIEDTEKDYSYLNIPKASHYFAQTKIKTSPYQYEAQKDIELIKLFCPTGKNNPPINIITQISYFIDKYINNKQLASNTNTLFDVIEFICHKYPYLYYDIACKTMYNYPEESILLFEKYIEKEFPCINIIDAWEKISILYKDKNPLAYINALIKLGINCISEDNISRAIDAANDINKFIAQGTIKSVHHPYSSMLLNFADNLAVRLKETNEADDYSKCAWIYLHAGDSHKAKEISEQGLFIDPQNKHCLNLKEKCSN